MQRPALQKHHPVTRNSSGSSAARQVSLQRPESCTVQNRYRLLRSRKYSLQVGRRLSAVPDSREPSADTAASGSSSPAQGPAPTTNTAADGAAGSPASDEGRTSRSDAADPWQQSNNAAGAAFAPGPMQQQQQQQQQQEAAARRTQPLRYSDVLAAASGAPAADQQQQQEQQQAQADALSLRARLDRLLSGRFIQEREAQRGIVPGTSQQQQQQQQGFNAKFAAVQFEMMQRLQQKGQQPSQPTSTPAATPPPPLGAAAAADAPSVSVGPDGIIDVSAEAATSTAAPASPAAAASATADTEKQAAGAAAAEAAAFYPAGTYVLVICIWAVFLLQWVQALPALWGVLTSGQLLDAAAAVLLAFPDTPVTQALCLDMTALQQGLGWLGLLTSGLCNSGFLATWLCCAALQTGGRWVEAGTGQLQLLTVFLICTLFASAGHVLAGRCALGVTGPGAVLGVYTSWFIFATQYLRGKAPLRTIYTQGLMLLGVLLVLGVLQPAVSAASLLGGVIGGAVAVYVAEPVSGALRYCLALPAMLGLLLLRLSVELIRVLWVAGVFVAAAAWAFVKDMAGTVRRL